MTVEDVQGPTCTDYAVGTWPDKAEMRCIRWQKGKGGGSRTTMATRCCHRWLGGFVVMCSCQSGQCLLVVVEHYQPILTLTLESFVFEYLCTLHSLRSSHRSPVLYQLAALRQARFQLYEYDQFRVFVTTPTSIYSSIFACSTVPTIQPTIHLYRNTTYIEPVAGLHLIAEYAASPC